MRPNRRSFTILLALFLAAGGGLAFSSFWNRDPVLTKVVLSEPYLIDRILLSMEGPVSTVKVVLGDPAHPELLWLVGLRTEIVAEDGVAPRSSEFMCHVNLDFTRKEHIEYFPSQRAVNGRVLTLSQGALAARFPKGFGIPVHSGETLLLTTQVLNLNRPDFTERVRHRVTFEYVRDAELPRSYRALMNFAPFGMKVLEGPDGVFGVEAGSGGTSGASCLPGSHAPNSTRGSIYPDGKGRKFSGHWAVKPGTEINHTRVTPWLTLPFDTTLHYAIPHLHPFARSLELRDLTLGKSIVRSDTTQVDDGVGLASAASFSSVEGTPIFEGHEYELVSVYENPTGADVDSMAVMLVFAEDVQFTRPSWLPPKIQDH
jgi:hypothetical protein